MRRFSLLILAVLILGILPSYAQADLRDYAITNVTHQFFPDDGILRIEVTVINNGTDASSETEVIFSLISDGNRILEQKTIPALEARGSVNLIGNFSIVEFEPGSEQTIEIAVGLDGFELRNTPIAEDN